MSMFPIRVFNLNHHVVFCITFFILTIHTTRAVNFWDYQGDMSYSDDNQSQEEFATNSGLFAIELYSKLNGIQPSDNIVFSPFSIQTCVAMARVAAEGKTADEIDRGLHLISSDVSTISESFSNVLKRYENSDILKIANRIYVLEGFHIRQEFQDIVTEKFRAGAEVINFAKSDEAAKKMNHWVETKTNNLIKDLIRPSLLTRDTRLVLLNAIHFKGQWKYKFNKDDTKDADFYLNDSDKVRVPMMNLKAHFLYAYLPELDATVLDMPYNNSDLSMLIILPNSRTGLTNLMEKLKKVQINQITSKMYSSEVYVRFPKFKADFSVELKDPMEKLGMERMFSDFAEFNKMLEENIELKVSEVIHKAFIDVNEEGTEAAAATVMKIMPTSSQFFRKRHHFRATHPFVYVVKSSQNLVIFLGSLSNIMD